MAICLTMTVILARMLRLVEELMDGKDSYNLATSDTLAHTTGMYSFPQKGSNYDERHLEQLDADEDEGGRDE